MTLIQLGYGPVSHILSYLNAKDLSCAGSSCRFLRALSPIAWNDLDARIGAIGCSQSPWPADRARRFYKASVSSAKMETLALNHYNYNDPERTHLTECRECKCFPHSLHARAIRRPELYEFFLRLSYRKAPLDGSDPLIWEGFVSTTKTASNSLFFDLRETYMTMPWLSMRAYLQLFSKHGVISADLPDLLALLYEAMDNLMVTVIAMERNGDASLPTSLLLSTGGFNDDFSTVGEFEHSYSLNPRNINTHGIRNDEDWLSVELRTSSTNLCEFRGLVVSHEW